MQTFMQSLEYIIGGSRQPLYDTTKTNEIYNSLFDDDIKDDNVDFPYSYELIDVNFEEISGACIDALDKYIGDEIVIPGRYVLPVL